MSNDNARCSNDATSTLFFEIVYQTIDCKSIKVAVPNQPRALRVSCTDGTLVHSTTRVQGSIEQQPHNVPSSHTRSREKDYSIQVLCFSMHSWSRPQVPIYARYSNHGKVLVSRLFLARGGIIFASFARRFRVSSEKVRMSTQVCLQRCPRGPIAMSLDQYGTLPP